MKVFIRTLGCPKNTVDSELLAVKLSKSGITIANSEKESDTVIVNTCAFIHDAVEESLQVIMETSQKGKKVIVTGCLPGRYGKKIGGQLPEAEAVFDLHDFQGITDLLAGRSASIHDSSETRSVKWSEGAWSYVKISDGCDRKCSFCIIPKIKGRLKSTPEEQIFSEVTQLVSQGAKEIVLVGQDITAYGKESGGNLAGLLRHLVKIPGDFHYRLLYLYPTLITQELIKIISSEEKIYSYYDMPIQHSSDKILKLMKRSYKQEDVLRLIDLIRLNDPDAVLRTTVITGFPGEGQKEFNELCGFARDTRFNHLGAFSFSPEKKTVAGAMKPRLATRIREKRRGELMEIQREISARHLEKFKGRTISAIVDGPLSLNVYTARNGYFTPEIDGIIQVHADQPLHKGQKIKVLIEKTDFYDLFGSLLAGI